MSVVWRRLFGTSNREAEAARSRAERAREFDIGMHAVENSIEANAKVAAQAERAGAALLRKLQEDFPK